MHLMHYGIKGQKWGVRRYQNEDGSLTPAGKSRYGNQTYKIDNNASLKRITAYESNDKYDDPLYVSRRPDDFREYVKRVDGLPSIVRSKNRTSVKVLDLQTTKKLNVANGKAVSDYILNKYGHKYFIDPEESEWLNEIYYDRPDENPFPKAVTYTEHYNNLMSDDKQKYGNDLGKVGANSLVYDLARENVAPGLQGHEEMIRSFKNKGYDAIVDPEDYFMTEQSKNVFKEPLIILDPSKTIRKTGEQYLTKSQLKNAFNIRDFESVNTLD